VIEVNCAHPASEILLARWGARQVFDLQVGSAINIWLIRQAQ